MSDKFEVVGHNERKLDAHALATGQPLFVADRTMPDTLVMKLLRSPLAHARIAHIDTSRAEESFGFRAAMSLRDGLRETIQWYRNACRRQERAA